MLKTARPAITFGKISIVNYHASIRMRMRALAIVSQKGSAGKTTLACALAGAGERVGLPSVLVEIDRHASAAHWAALREADTPIVTAGPAARLAPLLNTVRSAGAALAVSDIAPHAAEAAPDAAQAADLVLIPCCASAAESGCRSGPSGRRSPSPRRQGPLGGTRRPAGPEWGAGARPLPQPFLAEKRVGGPFLIRSGAAGDRPGLPLAHHGTLPGMPSKPPAAEFAELQRRKAAMKAEMAERKARLAEIKRRKKAEIQRRLRLARPRVDQAECKRRTRRPILMGGYRERLAARPRLRRGLDGFLDRDGELFGLEPKETAAEAADA